MKRCSNCVYFTAMRSFHATGLCDKHDWAVNDKYGRKCQDHKSAKTERAPQKRIAVKMIRSELNDPQV